MPEIDKNVQDAFDLLSQTIYFGPAFRQMLKTNKAARKALADLLRCVSEDEILMGLITKE